MGSRRSFLIGSFMLAGVAPAAAAGRIAVGYSLSSDMVALFVAQDEGMLRRHGLDFELTLLTLVSVGPAGLISGSLQISMANPTILLNAVAGGLDLVAIAGSSRHLRGQETTSLVARTGTGIRVAADLRGRKVGIPGFGSTNDLAFRKWLKMNGVAVADVNLIEVRLDAMKDLLRNQNLDAVAVLEPMRSRITDDATGYWVVDFIIEVRNGLNGAIWIAGREWAEAHRPEIEAFRAALAEALVFIAAQPGASRTIEAKYLKVTSPMRPYLALDVTTEDLTFFQDIMLEMGALEQPVDVGRLVFH